MALDITRLSGGNTPADGSDPRTFPAIWNATSDALEADVIPTDVTSPATGQLLQYDGTNWVNVGQADAGAIPVFADAAARTTAIPSPSEGMVTYLSDVNQVQAFTGSAFTAVGGILQVVQGVRTTALSATVAARTFQDIGVSASITPTSATSKILVFFSVAGSSAATDVGYLRLLRDATPIGIGDSAGSRVPVTGPSVSFVANKIQLGASHTFLDTPNTTSSTTYSLDWYNSRNSSSTVVINRSFTDTDDVDHGRGISTITLMEVAG